MKQMGVNSYRFSIAWTRILPKGTCEYINEEGIAHYNKLINELLRNNIEPIVTLYHWDLPLELELKYNGWLSLHIIDDFSNYAEICFEKFGDRVKKWITINEPWTFATMGYVNGVFAPGRCSDRSKCTHGDSATEGYIVGHHVLLAHAAAVDLYRKKYPSQEGIIGITLNMDWAEPLTSNIEDIEAAERRNEFSIGWFADPLLFGRYPQSMIDLVGDRLPTFSLEQQQKLIGSFDFYGLNHYSSKYFSNYDRTNSSNTAVAGWGSDQHNFESKVDIYGREIGPQAASSWLNVVPWGIYKVLKWNYDRYSDEYYRITNKKFYIIITENGCDAPGEDENPLNAQQLNDSFRVNYLSSYLHYVDVAIQEGVDVRGYFVWSLLDNFEWADSYTKRFGLFYVDFTDPKRTRYPKLSSSWYSQYIKSKSKNVQNEPNYWMKLLYRSVEAAYFGVP